MCEEPRSSFLQILAAYDAVNTRKQQKVFRWSQTPHDRIFLAQLDRDLERQAKGLDTVSESVAEPALSFTWTLSKSLLEQLGFEKTRAAVTMMSEPGLAHKATRDGNRRRTGRAISREGLKGLGLGAFEPPQHAITALGWNVPPQVDAGTPNRP